MFGWLRSLLRGRESPAPDVDDDEVVLAGVALPPEASEMIYRPVPCMVVEEPEPPLVGSVEDRMAKMDRRW